MNQALIATLDDRLVGEDAMPVAVLVRIALTSAYLSQLVSPLSNQGVFLPLKVNGNECRCILPTPDSNDQYFLIVSSLAPGVRPHKIKLEMEPTSQPAYLPLADTQSPKAWRDEIGVLADQLDKIRSHRLPVQIEVSKQLPPEKKTFFLFAHGKDFNDPENYVTLTSDLLAVGKHCQIYADKSCSKGDLQDLSTDIVRTFDEEIFPKSARKRGVALDVDGDGRFTIFLTPWLKKMEVGSSKLAGFVRGADFYTGLKAPFSNSCDMMYINSCEKPGPFLRSVLAHEYTHAVIFNEHVFQLYLPTIARQDEDAWLNEAICHLVEDDHGYSLENLDYRISAFLSNPQQYPLVVENYYQEGIWRTPGVRGGTYLFLRHCMDRFGPDVLKKLIQTNLNGTLNLEVTCGVPFAEIYRNWSAAILMNGMAIQVPNIHGRGAMNLREAQGRRQLMGPFFQQLQLAKQGREEILQGNSTSYFLLHSPKEKCTRLGIQAEEGTGLQVSLIKLPGHLGRMNLECLPCKKRGFCKLRVESRNSMLTLEKLVWEAQFPQCDGNFNTDFREGEPGNKKIIQTLGVSKLEKNQQILSNDFPIPVILPEGGRVVVKLLARDETGHLLTAWALSPN